MVFKELLDHQVDLEQQEILAREESPGSLGLLEVLDSRGLRVSLDLLDKKVLGVLLVCQDLQDLLDQLVLVER